jgi:hypothetical protein
MEKVLAEALSNPASLMKMSCETTPFESQLCEVKDSGTHGKGLFVKKDLKAGTPLTIYPVHQIGTKQMDGKWKIISGLGEEKVYGDYALSIDDTTTLYGCPTHYNAFCQGHLVNDPVLSLDHSDINKFIISYHLSAKTRANAKFQKNMDSFPILVFITLTKDVRAGDEILVPYRIPYWLQQFNLDVDKTLEDFGIYLGTLPPAKRDFILNLIDSLKK